MAFPTIRVLSGTGSDTAASGAGPGDGVTSGSALTGTAASTSGTGLVVTLDGSPDLTNVDTTGLHALYLADATAGARNFGKITAKANSGSPTAQVTVSDAFGLSLSGKSWAIGGKRATIAGTNSLKLFSNNSAAGDAMPGWAVEMQSGHSESPTTAIDLRRAGDTTSGPIVLRGAAGAATMPAIALASDTTNFFVLRADYQQLRDFTISAAGRSGMASGVNLLANYAVLSGLKLAAASSYFSGAILLGSGSRVLGCEVANVTGNGISNPNGNSLGTEIRGNYVHDNTLVGIHLGTAPYFGATVAENIIASNGHEGIYIDQARGDALGSLYVERNDVAGNGTSGSYSGINVVSSAAATAWTVVANNYLKSNSAWGVHFSSASVSVATLKGWGTQIRNNGFKTNTSGEVAANGVAVTDTAIVQGSVSAADPDNASYGTSGNYAKGTASTLYEAGWPTSNIGKSSTRSYVTIGAAQPHVAASGGGTIAFAFFEG